MSAADDLTRATDATGPENPLDSIPPPLVTSVLTNEDDKIAALKLVADTIAQQRNAAARAIIFNPIVIAGYILLLALINNYLYSTRSDIGLVVTTSAGITMTCLVAVRAITAPYINMAEDFKYSFIENSEGEEDVVIGTRFGDEIMGACILRLEPNPSSPNKSRKSKTIKNGGKGVVRAWAVRIRYRGKGVGTELLEKAVEITREKMGNGVEVGFAKEHANSKMILPGWLNSGFRKSERRAAGALDKVVETYKR
jgi:ribosomal protein S18 acetylase RimI-like enzyme